MKKIFAIIMSVLMIACFMPSMAFASSPEEAEANVAATAKTWDQNGKFKLVLKSGQTEATAEVYDDFSVSAKVVGDTVDAGSVTVGITMNKIKSLGMSESETKTKEETISTGITGHSNINLPNYFPHIFGCTSPSTFITNETNVIAFNGGIVKGEIDNKVYQ